MSFSGTCFTTKGAKNRYRIKQAGEGNGLTITLMMQQTSPFATNPNFLGFDIQEANGVNFAISDDQIGIEAALKTQGHTIEQPCKSH